MYTQRRTVYKPQRSFSRCVCRRRRTPLSSTGGMAVWTGCCKGRMHIYILQEKKIREVYRAYLRRRCHRRRRRRRCYNIIIYYYRVRCVCILYIYVLCIDCFSVKILFISPPFFTTDVYIYVCYMYICIYRLFF